MQALIGAAALISTVFGLVQGTKHGIPLFFRIVTYGFACYAVGTLYDILRTLLVDTGALPALALKQLAAAPSESVMPLVTGQAGFSVGLIGYAGAFFFLFSSYVGALDTLADGREPELSPYRMGSLAAPVLITVEGALLLPGARDATLPAAIALIPVALTSYFAAKHLVLPDVEMGIIRVMRPYNACVLTMCILQPVVLLAQTGSAAHAVACLLTAAAVLAALPLARTGVAKWFR